VAGGRPVGILETVPRINRLPLDQGSDSEEEEEEEGQVECFLYLSTFRTFIYLDFRL